jgi:RNA polymerase sigma factor (TIGR02999 family)
MRRVTALGGDSFRDDLAAWSSGDQAAGDRLYASAYDELKQVASRSLRAFGRGDALQTTALVHECYLKLVASGSVTAENRGHFLALCARAMRQIIVDSARRQLADKRDLGPAWRLTLSDSSEDPSMPGSLGPESIAALDQALTDLDKREPRLARIAECRIFSGMETPEIAATFGVTERTVQREWLRVKALLALVLDAGANG